MADTNRRYMAYDGDGIEVGYLTLAEARERYTSATVETTDEDGEPCDHTITVGEPLPRRCECDSCACDQDATTTDDGGAHVCDACADYYTTEDGEVVCSRTQDETTCRHCDQPIEWGHIQTRQYEANWREGRCECRTWLSTERGGTWVLSEGQAREQGQE